MLLHFSGLKAIMQSWRLQWYTRETIKNNAKEHDIDQYLGSVKLSITDTSIIAAAYGPEVIQMVVGKSNSIKSCEAVNWNGLAEIQAFLLNDLSAWYLATIMMAYSPRWRRERGGGPVEGGGGGGVYSTMFFYREAPPQGLTS